MWLLFHCGKRDFIQVLCSEMKNFFKYGVSVDNLFYFGCRFNTLLKDTFSKTYRNREKRKNIQPGIVAAGGTYSVFLSVLFTVSLK